ncbi:MAG TPA: hypothetical protein VLC92_12195 [Rhodocyclaceae bacterium]|nr:hypothetical protein [Rhodocyclaceae bacterium]
MSNLPQDIEDIIERLYRNSDDATVRSLLVYSDRWIACLRNMGEGFVTVDETDFNYGRAILQDLWLTSDARVSIHRRDIQIALLRDVKRLEAVRLSVSVLRPYFLLTFQVCELTTAGVAQRFAYSPESEAQRVFAEKISQHMLTSGYALLTQKQAETVIPDIETELNPRGTVTVGHCLMGD